MNLTEALMRLCLPTTKDIYSGAYRSGNNKDEHTCITYIVKSNNGSTENRGIQSNQDVYVYGIWWIGAYIVFSG